MRENDFILNLKVNIPPQIEGLRYLKTITIGIPYVRMKLNITTRREYHLPLAQEVVLRLIEEKWTNYDEIREVLGVDKDYFDKILLELGVADYITHMGRVISLSDVGRKVLLELKSIRIEPDYMENVYVNMLTSEIVKDENTYKSKLRNKSKCTVYLNNIEDLSGHFLANHEHEIRELYNIRVRESRDRFMGNDTVGVDELYRVITIEEYDRVYEQLPAHVYYSQDTDNIYFELVSNDNNDLYYTCLREQMKSNPRSFYEIYDTREYGQRKNSTFFKWYPEEEYAIGILEDKRSVFVTHLQSSSVDMDQICISYFTDRLLLYQEYQYILRSLTQKKPREVIVITDNLYMLEKSEYSLLALIEAISKNSMIYIGHGVKSQPVVSKIKGMINEKSIATKEFSDVRGTRIIIDNEYMLTIHLEPFPVKSEYLLQEVGILTYDKAHIELIRAIFPDLVSAKDK
jgi:hypothetical protein